MKRELATAIATLRTAFKDATAVVRAESKKRIADAKRRGTLAQCKRDLAAQPPEVLDVIDKVFRSPAVAREGLSRYISSLWQEAKGRGLTRLTLAEFKRQLVKVGTAPHSPIKFASAPKEDLGKPLAKASEVRFGSRKFHLVDLVPKHVRERDKPPVAPKPRKVATSRATKPRKKPPPDDADVATLRQAVAEYDEREAIDARREHRERDAPRVERLSTIGGIPLYRTYEAAHTLELRGEGELVGDRVFILGDARRYGPVRRTHIRPFPGDLVRRGARTPSVRRIGGKMVIESLWEALRKQGLKTSLHQFRTELQQAAAEGEIEVGIASQGGRTFEVVDLVP